jgi:hypothetical protein
MDQTRDLLLAKLSEAKRQQADAAQALQAHGARIEDVRKELGNPYFYGGRAADDPESETRFTGYKSHEPGLRLIRTWQDACREVEAIKGQLRAAGVDAD